MDAVQQSRSSTTSLAARVQSLYRNVAGLIAFGDGPAEVGPRPNWPALAGVRFLLAFAVVYVHWAAMLRPGALTTIVVGIGHVSVNAFLIISGFSIRHSYMKEPAGFYRRRLLRLLPISTMCLLVSALPWLIWGFQIPVPGDPGPVPDRNWSGAVTMLATLFMLNGVVGVVYPGLGPSVTMAVEILLYLGVPLYAKSERRPWILWLAIAISFTIYYTRWGTPCIGIPGAINYGGFWLLGWQFHRFGNRPIVRTIMLLILPTTILSVYWPNSLRIAGLVAIVPLCLCHMDQIRLSSARINRGLIYLGDLSFPLYLVHIPLTLAFGNIYAPFWLVFAISASAAVIILRFDPICRAWLERKPIATIAPPTQLAKAA